MNELSILILPIQSLNNNNLLLMFKLLWGIILCAIIISCSPKVGSELIDNSTVGPTIDSEEGTRLPGLDEVRTYVISDSVFFHMTRLGDPIITKKDFEIEVQPIGELEWQACININPVYFLDCACEASGSSADKEGNFCLTYSYSENDDFHILDAQSILSHVEEAVENAESENLCPKKHKKLEAFLRRPISLDKKFKYHLANIHRYEGISIPVNVLSHREELYKNIDFLKPMNILPGDSITRMVRGNSGGMEEQLTLYKTKALSEDFVELSIIHGYKIENNGMPWKKMGDMFVKDDLDFYSIHSNSGNTQRHIRTKDESVLMYFKDHSRANTPGMTHIMLREYRLKGFFVPTMD